MLNASFQINNHTGLHARPATDLCALAKRFTSAITISCGVKKINPRSIVSILTGEMTPGKTIQVSVSGDDEQAAMDALTDFLNHLED